MGVPPLYLIGVMFVGVIGVPRWVVSLVAQAPHEGSSSRNFPMRST
jgi:hypothetical protein